MPTPPLTQPVHASVTISRLLPVDIRRAWPSEPVDFTPWLLANSSALSEVLGIEIQLDQREYRVGPFALDLYGRVAGSDEVVIVENQYGSTDHSHLGQLMTYAGGTDPAVVIWIAEFFRDEHRAALDWLNEHTSTDVRFFGVKLAAVRLEGAPNHLVAPQLELVSEPNDWSKLAKAATHHGSGGSPSATTPVNALYQQFWDRFLSEARKRGWSNANAPAQNWLTMPTGTGSVQWGVSFATFGCRSELYFGHQDASVNEHRLAELAHKAEALQEAFGLEPQLRIDLMPGKTACRIEAQLHGPKISDESCWDAALDWMLDTQQRLRAAVSAVGGVPTALPPVM